MKTAKLNLSDEVYGQILTIILWFYEGKIQKNVAEYMLLDALSQHDPVLANEFKLYFEYCQTTTTF